MDTLPTYLGLRVRASRTEPHQWTAVNQFTIVLDHGTPCPKDTLLYRHGRLIEATLWGSDLGKLRASAKYLFGPAGLIIEPQPLLHDARLMLFSHAR